MSGENLLSILERPVTAAGGTLISTMVELRNQIEQALRASPQRLTLAKAYLDSLAWGIQGLAAMGQKIGFQILESPAPQEYPKMLFQGAKYQIAKNPTEEESMISEGFLPRVPEPWPTQGVTELRPLPAPTISVRMPTNEPDPDSDDFDDAA